MPGARRESGLSAEVARLRAEPEQARLDAGQASERANARRRTHDTHRHAHAALHRRQLFLLRAPDGELFVAPLLHHVARARCAQGPRNALQCRSSLAQDAPHRPCASVFKLQ